MKTALFLFTPLTVFYLTGFTEWVLTMSSLSTRTSERLSPHSVPNEQIITINCSLRTHTRLDRSLAKPQTKEKHMNQNETIIGIDIGKFFHVADVIDNKGKELTILKFDNSHQGFQELHALIKRYPESKIAIEATAHYWLPLADFLQNQNLKVFTINPIQSNSLRKFYIQPIKTDAKDAYIIANALRMDKVRLTPPLSSEVRNARKIIRYRQFLTKQLTACKIQLRTMLDEAFPEYQNEKLFTNPFCPSSLSVLKNMPTPNIIINHKKQLANLLNHHKGIATKKATKIYTAAVNSIGCKSTEKSLSQIIPHLIEIIQTLQEKIKQTEEILATIPAPELPILLSIPGMSTHLAPVILAEIGDVNRFPTSRNLVSYVGLAPATMQTGTFTASRTHISKRGSPYLRHAFYQLALLSIRYNPTLSDYYKKKVAEGKPKKVALIAVARKLVRIVYHLLLSKNNYEK